MADKRRWSDNRIARYAVLTALLAAAFWPLHWFFDALDSRLGKDPTPLGWQVVDYLGFIGLMLIVGWGVDSYRFRNRSKEAKK